MSSDVFQPSNGPLILQGSIPLGVSRSMDNYKKEGPVGMSSRPASQGGTRFGKLSHNSFFARHNPHPGRVRHIKGLLDVPICSVNDDGCLSNPRYAQTFPPNSYMNSKLSKYGGKSYNMPSNSMNVNNQLYPINTITGLQYFLGKPMNFRIFRERMSARNSGPNNANEAWRDELKALTEALGHSKPQNQNTVKFERPKTQYSETTGRLLPPPSRGMSRGMSRSGSRQQQAFTNTMQGLGADVDLEDTVMNMLAQILQTDDVNAVQQWLMGAGEREKNMVMDMIKQAFEAKEDVNRQVPAMDYSTDLLPEPEPKFDNDIIGDGDINDKIDRLTLEPPTPLPRPSSNQNGRQNNRPSTQQNGRPNSVQNIENVKMKYTFSPQPGEHTITEEEEAMRCSPSQLRDPLPPIPFGATKEPQAGGAMPARTVITPPTFQE